MASTLTGAGFCLSIASYGNARPARFPAACVINEILPHLSQNLPD
jgi:hypothetical protein